MRKVLFNKRKSRKRPHYVWKPPEQKVIENVGREDEIPIAFGRWVDVNDNSLLK